MASMKLLVCGLALIAAAAVESHPLTCKKQSSCECPDEYIRTYFVEIDCTIGCDFEWIQTQMQLIECQKDAAEYQAIIDLLRQLEAAKSSFSSCYDEVRLDIFSRVNGFRSKYSLLSICYTERIVSMRQLARRQLWPELCKFRSLYVQLEDLLDNFYQKYEIPCKPRPIALPRKPEYCFDNLYPNSPCAKDLTLLIDTCFKDYNYLWDLINQLNFPDNSPQCGRRQRLLDDLIAAWIEFSNQRRRCDIDFYPRFLDCKDDQAQIDIIYKEMILNLRPHQVNFARRWFNTFNQFEDLCNNDNIPIVDYIDYDNFTPETNIRGMYLPSKLLQDYFTHVIVTCRMDYVTACRLGKNLDFPRESSEWKRHNNNIADLKRRLIQLERHINKLICDTLNRIFNDYNKCPDNFDVEYRSLIDEIIGDCNNNLWPEIISFRQSFYTTDDCLTPIFKERGLVDVTRNIISSQTFGYDICVYLPHQEIRDLIRWFEDCLQENYYKPVRDLIQCQCAEGSEEYILRKKSLKELECIWLDYHNILNDLIRRLIDLIYNRKCIIGSDDYNCEIKKIIEWCQPRLVDINGKFKERCIEINGCLDNLYKKTTTKGCTRSYFFVEASFSFSSTRKTISC